MKEKSKATIALPEIDKLAITNVLGFDVVDATLSDFKIYLGKAIFSNKKLRVFALNPEKVIKAKNDEKVDYFLKHAEILIPDGIGILKVAKKMGKPLKSRITGVDTFEAILESAAEHSFKVFLFGAKKEVLEKAVVSITRKYGDVIAGYKDGYSDREGIVEKINHSKASVLFVGLGSPQQEEFMFENFDKLDVNIMQGVGGTFDVYSGNVKRAPLAFQKLNLEWFYRVLQDPRRINRIVKMTPFLKIVRDYAKKESSKID